jgi:hypothetical protein
MFRRKNSHLVSPVLDIGLLAHISAGADMIRWMMIHRSLRRIIPDEAGIDKNT